MTCSCERSASRDGSKPGTGKTGRVQLTLGGRQPQPGSGSPSEPSGHGASSPGTPCSPLSPRSPLRPRLPSGPASPLPPFSPRGPSWPGMPSVPGRPGSPRSPFDPVSPWAPCARAKPKAHIYLLSIYKCCPTNTVTFIPSKPGPPYRVKLVYKYSIRIMYGRYTTIFRINLF